jgi:hypothetical protein
MCIASFVATTAIFSRSPVPLFFRLRETAPKERPSTFPDFTIAKVLVAKGGGRTHGARGGGRSGSDWIRSSGPGGLPRRSASLLQQQQKPAVVADEEWPKTAVPPTLVATAVLPEEAPNPVVELPPTLAVVAAPPSSSTQPSVATPEVEKRVATKLRPPSPARRIYNRELLIQYVNRFPIPLLLLPLSSVTHQFLSLFRLKETAPKDRPSILPDFTITKVLVTKPALKGARRGGGRGDSNWNRSSATGGLPQRKSIAKRSAL